MTSLWIFIAVLLLLAVVIIWHHFFKANLPEADQGNMRGQTNKELYHEHLKELEKDLAEGGIDEESFGYLKEELDRSLLIDMTATEREDRAQDKKTSLLWPFAISVFVIAFSSALYNQQGAFEQLAVAQTMPTDHPSMEGDEHSTADGRAQLMIKRMQELHQEVKSNPENSDAWYELGQMLTNIGEYESAFVAFDKVIEVEGPQADVLAMQAQIRFYQNNQQMNEEVQGLLDKALALDPNDPSSLMLIGMDHYLSQRFANAASTWQKILDSNLAGSNSKALLDAINDAKARAQMGDKPPVLTDTPERDTVKAAQTPTAVIDGPSLSLSVSLSDEIIAILNQGSDKAVFIYAIPTNGTRMPLAAVRIAASDLPIDVILDNSKAMSPQMNLSTTDEVNILAVISMAGKPGVQPGDMKGELQKISVNHQEKLNLVINTVVE